MNMFKLIPQPDWEQHEQDIIYLQELEELIMVLQDSVQVNSGSLNAEIKNRLLQQYKTDAEDLRNRIDSFGN
tara:strand:+ start:2329 stop:2544 length:216 start_codon:yes stop_codon:yes gene_type:complete